MRSPVQDYLEAIAEQCSPDTSGHVASYIQELATADPDVFGVALATVDGHVYEVGDARAPLTIQSISKPFTYALALADRGMDAVGRKIDVEPSGEAFNEISLSATTGRPRNPMINAGAITAAALVEGAGPRERFERSLAFYGRFAGRTLEVDDAAHASEMASSHRNLAIAHMLTEAGVLEHDPEEVVDQYVRQCSVLVDTVDLALMAATLANNGVHPRTGDRVLSTAHVEHLLSVMTTCGMYDAAGDWVSAVGMPAKSGVSGGIIAVLPGQVGVAVFSPRLDEHGNSVRGVDAFEKMSSDMGLHLMHVGRGARSAVRSSLDLAQLRSRRRRSVEEEAVLDEHSGRARVHELHGDLLFAGAESVVRTVVEDDAELVVLDVRRVEEVADVARIMLNELHDRLRLDGRDGALVDPGGRLAAPDGRDATAQDAVVVLDTRDAAVEWLEERVLERHGEHLVRPSRTDARDHPLVRGLGDEAWAVVEPLLERRHHTAGEVVLEAGSRFAGVHLVVSGRAAVRAPGPDDAWWHLLTSTAGMSFGELALGSDGRQETQVVALDDLELLVLPADALERLDADRPQVAAAIWRALVRDAYQMTDRALRESAVREHS
ncbi:MAG: glutaminase A [Nocardioidaceae bacterium]|nr:glutaminase A [Nocardioidaceae bacterium]